MDLKHLTEEPHAKLIMALVAIFGLVLALRAYEAAKNNAATSGAIADGQLANTAPIDQQGNTTATTTTTSGGTTSSTATTNPLPTILNLGFTDDVSTLLSGEDTGSGQSQYAMNLQGLATNQTVSTGTSGGSGFSIFGINIGLGGSGQSTSNSNTVALTANEALSSQAAYDQKANENQSNAFTSDVSLENPSADQLTQVLNFLTTQTNNPGRTDLATQTQSNFNQTLDAGGGAENIGQALSSNAPNPVLQVTLG